MAVFVLRVGQALFDGDGARRGKNGAAERDLPRALYWLRRGHAAHVAHAQHALGVVHDQGLGGLAADRAEAARLFALAAAQGLAAARFNLAVCLRDGLGVAQDVPESVRLTVLAAKQGYARAQANLAMGHIRGTGGLEVDYKEALGWARKAAG